jgi:hypothetical protein
MQHVYDLKKMWYVQPSTQYRYENAAKRYQFLTAHLYGSGRDAVLGVPIWASEASASL